MQTTPLLIGLLTFGAASALSAQVRIERNPGGQAIRAFTIVDDENRPRIGLATGPGGKLDTLGLLVTDVTPDSPADKAGIEEGDRLQSVNGVNLRIQSADLDDEIMEGIAARRLIREVGKLEVGAEVDLQVYRDGRTRSVKVKTVAAKDLQRERVSAATMRSERADRATLGIGLGGSGSRRDTAGILIASVVDDGPADKARLEEGDRIAAINGVDLRVPREDAGDWAVTSSRMRRLHRELDRVKAGDEVELRVVRSGQTRTVRVQTVAQKDLPRGSGGMFFFGGDGPSMIMRDGGFSFTTPRGIVTPGTREPMVYFDRFDDGAVRMRMAPEVRLKIDERISEVMSKLRDAEVRVRPRVRIDGQTWHDDASAPRPAPAPRVRITTGVTV
jgi:S1-C subfamily serine protease